MSETYPLNATITTNVWYRLPGEDGGILKGIGTRDVQEVLRLLPANVVSFFIYNSLDGSADVEGYKLEVAAEYFNESKMYYVDAELVSDDDEADGRRVLVENQVRVRLSDGRIEHEYPERFELVSFTG